MLPFRWISNPSLYSFTSHSGLSTQVEHCRKMKRERKALDFPCQVRLHNIIRDLFVNLITWDYTHALWQCVMLEKENRFYIFKRHDPSELRGMTDSSAVCLKRLSGIYLHSVNHSTEVFFRENMLYVCSAVCRIAFMWLQLFLDWQKIILSVKFRPNLRLWSGE